VLFFRVFYTPFILCLLLSGCDREPVKGNPSAGRIQTAASQTDGSADGCVWVVDSTLNGRLYLCGTIHILREQDYPLAPGYEAAYRGSDKLLLELPPVKGSGPELSMKMSQLGTFSSDTSLEAHVGAHAWKAVQTWALRRGLDPSSMKRFRPWFVSLLITSKEYALLGATPELGVDKHFSARAESDGKPGEGLETDDFQLQMFTSLTNEQQRELLDQTLAELSTVPDEYEKMILAWKKGDLPALHAMLFREAEKHPDLMNLFLTDRNRVWIEKLDAMLRRGEKVMVLVGAGHLTGDAGLIELLKKRGHQVRHYREVKHF
jgi:uncharacterized protein YbaP (TraB family)